MERKLVKQGRNALTTTLPAKWLSEKGLVAGNTIQILEKESELIITAGLQTQLKETEITITGKSTSYLSHEIIARYIAGYDRIIIHHEENKASENISGHLLGMVIEHHSPSKTILASIITTPEKDITKIIKRSAYILREQAQTLHAITKGEANIATMNIQEKALNQNIFYSLRHINKYNTSAYDYFMLCTVLESAGDLLLEMAKYHNNNTQLTKQIANITDKYVTLLFTEDVKELTTTLKEFRNNLETTTFLEGLAYSYEEALYNFLGFITKRNL